MPGNLSQGWPGLIFLSSLSFLTPDEESALHLTPAAKAMVGIVVAHETAHQWWGDSVLWNDYRDQWLAEALANYSDLMLLETQDTGKFHEVMQQYRDDLLAQNGDGAALMQDGAVTLGNRLSCSQFPNGYEAISYGRGTWLLHMLRNIMRDAQPSSQPLDSANEPFVRALRRIVSQYQGKAITTRLFLKTIEDELPQSLWFEGHKSLDWFYDGWVQGTAVPHYELKNMKFVDGPQGTTITGILLQKDAPDDLVTSVPLYSVHEENNMLLGRVFADGAETPIRLTAPLGTRKVVVDPNQTILSRPR
jgi:aminopeptidase N